MPILSEKVPDEIFQLVESFKKFVRKQKALKDQNFTVDVILDVNRELEEFSLAYQRVAVDSHRNSQLVQQIREDTQKLLRQSEIAYSLMSSHPSNPPIQQQQQQQYFVELADQFEARMKAYGEQIHELKMSLDSITRTQNMDELFKWLKKQHETLGEIAAKIYMTHERVMEKMVTI